MPNVVYYNTNSYLLTSYSYEKSPRNSKQISHVAELTFCNNIVFMYVWKNVLVLIFWNPMAQLNIESMIFSQMDRYKSGLEYNSVPK